MVRVDSEQYESTPKLKLAPGWRICARPVAVQCPTNDIHVATLGADGTVLLADHAGIVRIFDSTGSFKGTVGTLGRGSDGYLSADAVRAGRDGRIYVVDRGNFELLVFGSNGQLAHRLRLPPSLQLWGLTAWPGGAALLELPPAAHFGDPVAAEIQLVADNSGREQAVSFSIPLKAIFVQNGSLQPPKPFFQARPVWSTGDEGSITIADGSSRWIARYSQRGEPDLLVRLPIAGVPVTPAEVQAEKARVLNMFTGDWKARVRPTFDSVAANSPHVHPFETAMVTAHDGTLWIRESPRTGDDSVRWDALSKGDSLIGALRLSRNDRVADESRFGVLVVHDTAGPTPWVSVNKLISVAQNTR